jgi:hypothetical protein
VLSVLKWNRHSPSVIQMGSVDGLSAAASAGVADDSDAKGLLHRSIPHNHWILLTKLHYK